MGLHQENNTYCHVDVTVLLYHRHKPLYKHLSMLVSREASETQFSQPVQPSVADKGREKSSQVLTVSLTCGSYSTGRNAL